MKADPARFALLLILAIIVAAYASCARAQDGAHSHPALEAKNAEQDARLAERESVDAAQGAAIVELRAADEALTADMSALRQALSVEAGRNDLQEEALADILARLTAIEKGPDDPAPEPEPEPTPDPEPDPDPAPPTASLPHDQPAIAFPVFGGDRPVMQINTAKMAYWDPEDALIDKTKLNMNGRWTWVCGSERTGLTDLVAGGYVSAETLYPVSSPPCATRGHYQFGLFLGAMNHMPAELWTEYAQSGVFIAEWTGQATIDCRLNDCVAESLGPNKARLTVSPRQVWAFLMVREPGPDFGGLTLYHEEDADLVAAGRIYTDRFVETYSRYDIVRTMDWQNGNNCAQRTAAQGTRLADPGWADNELRTQADLAELKIVRVCYPLDALFALPMETGTALHMIAPQFLCAPESVYDAILAKSMTDFAAPFALDVIECPEWDKWADEVVRAMIDSGYPEDRLLIIELANEVWNFAGGSFWWATNYYAGLGSGLSGGTQGFRYGYGYASARLAEAIEKALARAGRKQAWRIGIAGQHVNSRAMEISLDGYGAYFSERNIDAAPWYKIAGTLSASYYSRATSPGRFSPETTAEDNKAWWLNQIATRDRDELATELADYIINSDEQLSIPFMLDFKRKHKAVAEKYGATYLGDYEGMDNDPGPHNLQKEPAFAHIIDWFRYSEHGARVTKAWADGLYAFDPETIISNYGGVCPAEPNDDKADAPWCEGWYTQDTERKRALDEYLRPQ